METKINFIIDIGMPTLLEELKSYGGTVVILKEKNHLEEDFVHKLEDNVLKIDMKSLSSIEDFDKAIEIINEYEIGSLDYIFPFNERKYDIYWEFIKKYKIKSNLKEAYVKNSKKSEGRRLVNEVFNDVMSSELTNIDIENFKFPCIIKPLKGNGSTDITKIKNKDELEKFIEENDTSNYFVEEFISGKEISIEAIHYKGNHLIYGVTRKIKYEDSFVEEGHIADYYRLNDQQLSKVKKIYDILDYDNTVSHSEFMLLDDGIVMIESHPRLGGDLIPSFYESKFETNLYEVFVKCLMGDLYEGEKINELKYTMFSIFPIPSHFPSKIYLDDSNKEELETNYGINLIIQNKENGTLINKSPEDSFDRPLTLRVCVDKSINIDEHIAKIKEYCIDNIFNNS